MVFEAPIHATQHANLTRQAVHPQVDSSERGSANRSGLGEQDAVGQWRGSEQTNALRLSEPRSKTEGDRSPASGYTA